MAGCRRGATGWRVDCKVVDTATTHRLRAADDRDELDDARALAQARRRLLGRGAALSLSRYELGPQLGAGAVGTVYRARDPQLQRDVAIKVVQAGRGHEGSAGTLARVAREARTLARLNHPGIVSIFDVGVLAGDGGLFVVMELCEGGDLAQWLAAGRPRAEILHRFRLAGQGLWAAHQAGVVHRDFKPANVLCSPDGRVRVADFGLARALLEDEPSTDTGQGGTTSGSDRITRHGFVVGTPRYMAPEQHDGEPIDARADQFAFCVALHEALSGVAPFSGESLAQLATAKREGRWRALPRDVPAQIRRAIAKGLHPEPGGRHRDMGVLLAALRPSSPRRARRLGLGIALVGVVAAVGAQLGRDDDTCAVQGQAVARTWSDPARAATRAAFAATGAPYAHTSFSESAARIDAYVAQLQDETVHACRANDLARVACLRGAGIALDEVVGAWREADAAMVEHAATTLAGLPRLDPCRAPGGDAWPQDLARRHAQIVARDALGDARGGLRLVDEALADPRARPVQISAELHRQRGRLLGIDDRKAEAERELQAAYHAATAAGIDDVAADAATDLVLAAGSWGGRIDDGLEWGRHGLALADRLDDDARRGRTLDNLGEVLELAGRDEEALDHHVRARALLARAHGEGSMPVAIADNRIGNASRNLGRTDEAEAAYRRAMDVFAREGADHPRVARVLGNLGNVALDRGDTAEAIALHEDAARRLARAYGPDHDSVGIAENGIGNAKWDAGDHAGALPHYARGLAVLQRALGPDHPLTATVAYNTANRQVEVGQTQAARASYRLAATAFRREDRSGARLQATLTMWGELEATTLHHELARELLTEAEALATARDDDPAQVGMLRLRLSQVCDALDDREAARRWADDGLAALQRADDVQTLEVGRRWRDSLR